MTPTAASTAPDPAEPQRGLICPQCGYDLRATTSGRCPECGQAFDAATLAVSRIPWVHRREIGRIRGWWRTVQFVIGSPRKLAEQTARPVAWPDASCFRWVTLLITAAFLAVALTVLFPRLDLSVFRFDYPAMVDPSEPLHSIFKWGYPVVAVWTGSGILLAITASLLAAGTCISWWTRSCFWMLSKDTNGRASTLSCYFAAWSLPIAFLVAVDVMISVYPYFLVSNWKWVILSLLALAHLATAANLVACFLCLLHRSTGGNVVKITFGFSLVTSGNCIMTLLAVAATSFVLGLAAAILKTLSI